MKPVVKRLIGWGTASVIAASSAMIASFEGKRNEVYLDAVGVPTVCYGHTGKHVKNGVRYTDQQCLDILTEDIIVHHREMRQCVKAPLAIWEEAAVLSMFFNFGPTKMCPSTLVRLINQGAPPEQFCPQILRWNKAGGKVLRGLVIRRELEHELCLGHGMWLVKPTTLLTFIID